MDALAPSTEKPEELKESPSLFNEEPNYWSSPFTYEIHNEPSNLQKDEGIVNIENYDDVSEEITDEKTRKKLEKVLEKYQLKKLAYQTAYLKKLEKEGHKLEKKVISLQKASEKSNEKVTKAVANVPVIKKSLLYLFPRWIPKSPNDNNVGK